MGLRFYSLRFVEADLCMPVRGFTAKVRHLTAHQSNPTLSLALIPLIACTRTALVAVRPCDGDSCAARSKIRVACGQTRSAKRDVEQ